MSQETGRNHTETGRRCNTWCLTMNRVPILQKRDFSVQLYLAYSNTRRLHLSNSILLRRGVK